MKKLLRWAAPLAVAMFFAMPICVMAKGEWKLTQNADKDFSISMPADAKAVDKHVKNVTINAFTATEDGTNYSITHGAGVQASPGAIDSIGEGAIVEFKKQAEAVGVSLTVDKTEEAKGEGWAGKKSFISIGPAKLQMLAALSDNKNVGYCLIAASQAGSNADPEFFNSFKVDTKRTNELYANKGALSGELIGQIIGGIFGAVIAFFVVSKLNKKKQNPS